MKVFLASEIERKISGSISDGFFRLSLRQNCGSSIALFRSPTYSLFSFVFTLSTVSVTRCYSPGSLKRKRHLFMLYRQLYRRASFTVLTVVYTMWHSRIPRDKVFILLALLFSRFTSNSLISASSFTVYIRFVLSMRLSFDLNSLLNVFNCCVIIVYM